MTGFSAEAAADLLIEHFWMNTKASLAIAGPDSRADALSSARPDNRSSRWGVWLEAGAGRERF